jgi:transposase
MTPYRDITDDQWRNVLPLFPELRPRAQSRGRPLTDTRAVLNGVLWVIYSGAAWSAMPRRYPSYQTCHRRFKAWHTAGVFKQVLAQLYGDASSSLCEAMAVRMRVKAKHVPKETSVPVFASVDAPKLAYMASLRRAA